MNDQPPPDGLLGLSQRQPPSNIQAEQSLLGSILANNKAFGLVAGFLRPEHFVDPVHGRIYEHCARLITRGQLADAVTLKSIFEHAGILEEVGGTPYLAQLLTAMVGIINAGAYGRAIHNTWLRRQLIEIGETIVNEAFAPGEADGDDLVAAAADQIMTLTGAASKEAPEVMVGAAARAAIERHEGRRTGTVSAGLSTGVRAIDDAINGGLEDTYLYILGGRPRMGKSSLATQIAVAAARQLRDEAAAAPPFSGAGGVVVYFTLEMGAEQVGWWATCHIAGVANDVFRKRDPTPAEAKRLIDAQTELDTLPLMIIHAAGMSSPAIALRARAIAQRHRVRLVIGDHLSKLVADRGNDRGGNETTAMAKATSGQKNLANQLRVPVLWLAQLGREVDRRDDPRPILADLLYAGEQDADVAMFLFREEEYLKRRPPEKFARETDEQYAKRRESWRRKWDECEGRAELIIAKQREGREGTVLLGFAGERSTFRTIGGDLAGYQNEPLDWDQIGDIAP